ncbi:hypothetical protein [Blastococcus sp. Marseille-P5729]|uniref:hypothetical protein n=1 Tax=Blastococcus sp. Marseille-P5729 TaxID=2086582 RepID=UPI000D1022E1|nr:hypothetical protein [Blastococcus sp. Marseille-P5729]
MTSGPSHGADAEIDEKTPLPTGSAELPQMTGIASAWEGAASEANAASQTILRTSVVFDQDCPAFDRLAGLARLPAPGRRPPGDLDLSDRSAQRPSGEIHSS